MDSELSIDEIVTALHFSLEKTLKISLGPFVDKFNSSRNQFNVVSDLLKQLPEYKEIIKHNAMLSEENRILKEYIRNQNTKNNTTNRIKLEISEKDDQEEIEKIFSEAENQETAKFGITSTMESEEEALTREEEEEDEEEEEEVEVDEEEEEVEVVEVVEVEEEEVEVVEVVEVDVEEEEDEVVEVDVEEEEVDEDEEVEVVEEEEVEVDEEEEEEEEVEVVEEEDDDEISNNDVSQTPRSVVNTNEETEDEDDDDEEGLIEVVISGKDYFADNDEDGDIYEKISDDEPGDDPIGIFKDGVATFF
tara:strand:+ start:3124 stop:4038 length:915 start_codon:yes stop_codon:yes gene_type:complete